MNLENLKVQMYPYSICINFFLALLLLSIIITSQFKNKKIYFHVILIITINTQVYLIFHKKEEQKCLSWLDSVSKIQNVFIFGNSWC